MPVADGGQGTLDALVSAAGGRTRSFAVADPLGRPVDAPVGLLPGGTAVVELASASGYERLAAAERDPEATSTYGTGELIRAALDLGARRIIVAVGGSATTDGGLGVARALGVRALDDSGAELPGRGCDLSAWPVWTSRVETPASTTWRSWLRATSRTRSRGQTARRTSSAPRRVRTRRPCGVWTPAWSTWRA